MFFWIVVVMQSTAGCPSRNVLTRWLLDTVWYSVHFAHYKKDIFSNLTVAYFFKLQFMFVGSISISRVAAALSIHASYYVGCCWNRVHWTPFTLLPYCHAIKRCWARLKCFTSMEEGASRGVLTVIPFMSSLNFFQNDRAWSGALLPSVSTVVAVLSDIMRL